MSKERGIAVFPVGIGKTAHAAAIAHTLLSAQATGRVMRFDGNDPKVIVIDSLTDLSKVFPFRNRQLPIHRIHVHKRVPRKLKKKLKKQWQRT